MLSIKTVCRVVIVMIASIVTLLSASAQIIVGSDRHASLLCADGSVYSWGYNTDALLGDGTTDLHKSAIRSDVKEITYLTCKQRGTAALDSSGNVFFWGGSQIGQFGISPWNFLEPAPTKISIIASVRKVLVNNSCAYFLLRNDSVAVTTAYYKGLYGNGTTTKLDSGYALAHIDSVIDIVCGADAVYAIRRDGKVYGWGYNGNNQVDSSANTVVAAPVLVFETNGVRSSAGSYGSWYGYHSMGSMRIVDTTGTVWVWGVNTANQLGQESPPYIYKPVKISLPRKCVAVSGGLAHTLFLLDDGTVWACGDNKAGQLGIESVTRTATPMQVPGLTNVLSIGTGTVSSYAYTSDGRLWGWGDNNYRQLNLDGVTVQYTPTEIPLPCAVTGIVAEQAGTHSSLVCSPNPVHNMLTISLPSGFDKAEIVNLHGQTIATTSTLGHPTSATFDLSREPAGVYVVVAWKGQQVLSARVLKVW